MHRDVGQGFRRLQSRHVGREGGPLFILFSPWRKDSRFAQAGVADAAAHARDENAAFWVLAVIGQVGCGAR